MQKTTIPGMTILQLERTHAWWRYFWPYRSRRAQLQTLAVLAVEVPILGAAMYALNPSWSLVPVLIGVTIGVPGGAYPLLPARLTMATRDEAWHALAGLQARLVELGYVASDKAMAPGCFHYRHKSPRWLRWDEQDVELLMHGHELVLNGPMFILRRLRAKMLLPDDRTYLKT